jgi:hypothetical protein
MDDLLSEIIWARERLRHKQYILVKPDLAGYASLRQQRGVSKLHLAITEFGCATHRGAGDRGGRGGSEMIEYDGTTPMRLNGDYIRDEQEQATHLRELLDIFTAESVDAAFACTFVCYGWPHRSNPREDLDMASWGVVKVLENRLSDTYPDVSIKPFFCCREVKRKPIGYDCFEGRSNGATPPMVWGMVRPRTEG